MAGGKNLWKLCLIVTGIIITQFASAQDTVKTKCVFHASGEEWLVREDVIGFVSPPFRRFAIQSDIVKKTELAGAGKNVLVIYFKDSTSQKRKSAYIETLKQQGLQKQLLAISLPAEAGSPFNDKLLFIDDFVLVAFKTQLTKAELEAFEEKYNLHLVHEPELYSGKNNSIYIFRYPHFNLNDNSATLSAKIIAQERQKVLLAQPNRVNLFEQNSSNDEFVDIAWHIANSGQLSCSSLTGRHNADAHITGAWDLGYTGQGIKVGVIDFYGFDYNHPDMQGQLLEGWDCINNSSYNASNFYFTDAAQSHGMAVCGVIGAIGNNRTGAAGVAYGAKVVPFLIDGSESSVVLAMQKAMSPEFDVDVVNCSFGSYFPSPAIETEIKNLTRNGRFRNGNTYGIIVVASHGNDHYNDIDHPQYPAAYDEVLSVAASTPDDRKKTPGDGWETTGSWGTNYGALLDIAAPGVCIFTTDISGSNGYSSGDYVAFQKTSASAPIVSGVAALVLSKNPDMSWQDVKKKIQDSADKTNNSSEGGSYDYDYDANKPGQSMEMGYGRVNAEKAVSDAPVSINNDIVMPEKNRHLILNPIAGNSLDIRYWLNENHHSYGMGILDMSGRLLLKLSLPAGSGMISMDISKLTPGIYFVKCFAANEIVSNEKFVKVR